MGIEQYGFENVKCLRSTEKAILVSYEGTEFWVPQSVVTDDSEVWKNGDEGDLVVKMWWAEKKLGELES